MNTQCNRKMVYLFKINFEIYMIEVEDRNGVCRSGHKK